MAEDTAIELSEEEIQALARRAADDPMAAERLWQVLGE